MLEQLFNLVKENAGSAIINNPAIPNERNDEAVETTASSIFDVLKDQLSNGGVEAITDIFKGGGTSGSVIESVSQNAAGSLMKKFGIENQAATDIVNQLIPVVIGKFVNKTNDPNDSSFDVGSILSSIGGAVGNSKSGGGGIFGMLKGLLGGK